MDGGAGPTLLYLVTEDWYFCSHRLPVARAARDAGARVIVATRVRDHGATIAREGFALRPLEWRRGSRSPWNAACAVAAIRRLYRAERPDLVHHVSLKPVLCGSLAAGRDGPVVLNALTGLGTLSLGGRHRLLGGAVGAALPRLLGGPRRHVLVQNPDDREQLLRRGLAPAERVSLIRGSGVDLERFAPAPEPPGPPVVLLVARMLAGKGVADAVAAARLLRERGRPVRLLLAGPGDPENRTSVPPERLAAWQAEGLVQWLGPVAEVPALWRQAHIGLLPSHGGEGVPKALLEGAACGRPLVATDVPGCREIVRPGESGLLVPPRDPPALAAALSRLAEDAELRARLGAGARRLAAAGFGEAQVAAETLALYRRLLPEWR
jgi:glycosyltransferase involved in cell wall biosynthesis